MEKINYNKIQLSQSRTEFQTTKTQLNNQQVPLFQIKADDLQSQKQGDQRENKFKQNQDKTQITTSTSRSRSDREKPIRVTSHNYLKQTSSYYNRMKLIDISIESPMEANLRQDLDNKLTQPFTIGTFQVLKADKSAVNAIVKYTPAGNSTQFGTYTIMDMVTKQDIQNCTLPPQQQLSWYTNAEYGGNNRGLCAGMCKNMLEHWVNKYLNPNGLNLPFNALAGTQSEPFKDNGHNTELRKNLFSINDKSKYQETPMFRTHYYHNPEIDKFGPRAIITANFDQLGKYFFNVLKDNLKAAMIIGTFSTEDHEGALKIIKNQDNTINISYYNPDVESNSEVDSDDDYVVESGVITRNNLDQDVDEIQDALCGLRDFSEADISDTQTMCFFGYVYSKEERIPPLLGLPRFYLGELDKDDMPQAILGLEISGVLEAAKINAPDLPWLMD